MLEQKPWIQVEAEEVSSPGKLLRSIPETLAPDQFWDFVHIHEGELFPTEIQVNHRKIIIGAKLAGGYADVFFGWYEGMPPQFVVIKMLTSRYINEERTATRLTLEKFFFEQQNATDPNGYWPTLLDEGRIRNPLCLDHDPIDCMVVELIPGLRLDKLIATCQNITKNPAFAAAAGIQVIHALKNLHEGGSVYRDIKPENILITYPKPGRPFVRLFDANAILFPNSDLTDPGICIGTAEYMSPEGARREKQDLRSDQYSLGCLLYEMIGGRSPFTGYADYVMRDHLRTLPAELDSSLWPIISRLLAKNPRERYGTDEEVRRALQGFALEDSELAEYARVALL